jgi:hypothetical protein
MRDLLDRTAATLERVEQGTMLNNYGTEIVDAFLESELALTHLFLPIETDQPLLQLAASPRAARLRTLTIRAIGSGTLTREAAQALADSPYLDRLGKLDVFGNSDDTRLAPLIARFGPRLAFA